MKIIFLGDSITEGWAATDFNHSFVATIGDMLGIKTKAYGIGGTRIACQPGDDTDNLYFGRRVKDMDKDADYVFVMGGTNDYGHGRAPLGKFSDKSHDTFYGGMNYLVEELLKYYSNEKIIFLSPLYRFNEADPHGNYKTYPIAPLDKYREIIVDVLNRHNIAYWDIKDEFGKPLSENDEGVYYDGLHPNTNGHHLLAEIIIKHMKENNII